jgi:predicted PurR-regulated permease PerM
MNMAETTNQETSTPPAITTVQWSRAARYITAVLFLFALIGLLILVSPILTELIAAVLIAFLLDLPIRFFSTRTRLSYRWTAIVVYMLIYILLAVLLLGGSKYLVSYLGGLISALTQAGAALISWLQGNPSEVAQVKQVLAGVENEVLIKVLEPAIKILIGILSAPVALFAKLASVIVNVGFSVFMSNLLVFSAYSARGILKKWVPESFNREFTLLLAWIERIWGRYLAGMGLFAVVLGAASIVEYWLLGVPYPVIFGILTGLISLIPFVGGFISGLVVFIPCLLLGSTRFTELSPLAFGVIVAIINDILCQVSYNFVALPIIGKLVKLPYWVVLSAVMLGAALNSVLFAFLVIPTFSTLRLVYTYFLSKIVGREPFLGQETPTEETQGFLSQFVLGEKTKA